MIPKWSNGVQLSQHLTACQQYILSYTPSDKLELAQSLRLDSSWRSEPRIRDGVGKRRSVICEIDTVECAGCCNMIPATQCYEALSNPFSTARCMLVCSSCKDLLTEDTVFQ